MSALDGLRTSEDPGLDVRRLAANGAVTPPRKRVRRWARPLSLYGPALPLAFAAGMLAGVTLRVFGL